MTGMDREQKGMKEIALEDLEGVSGGSECVVFSDRGGGIPGERMIREEDGIPAAGPAKGPSEIAAGVLDNLSLQTDRLREKLTKIAVK